MIGALTQKLPHKLSPRLLRNTALIQRSMAQSHAPAQTLTATLAEPSDGEIGALTPCWQLNDGCLVMRWQLGGAAGQSS